jgi:hypothetical protein
MEIGVGVTLCAKMCAVIGWELGIALAPFTAAGKLGAADVDARSGPRRTKNGRNSLLLSCCAQVGSRWKNDDWR